MARHCRPGDNPRAGLFDVQVHLKQDQRPQHDRQSRRSDVGEAVQVREVIMLLGNHGADDHVNQRNDSSHSHSHSHKTISWSAVEPNVDDLNAVDRELRPKHSPIAVRAARTPGSRAEQGDPLRHRRPRRRRGAGQTSGSPMTPPVRGCFDPRLVGAPRTGTLACATSLTIIPDCGGSNGYRDPPSRRRVWLVGVRGWSGSRPRPGGRAPAPVMSQAPGSSCQRPRPCRADVWKAWWLLCHLPECGRGRLGDDGQADDRGWRSRAATRSKSERLLDKLPSR